MVLDRKDFGDKETKNPEWAAYTIASSGRFHICEYGFKNRGLMKDISCDNLDESCSNQMRSLAMTLLHEMTHYDKIGSDSTNEGIIDYKPTGAYPNFKLDDDEKLTNAQNYAWLAGEQYYADKCNKVFDDPAKNVDAAEEDEDGAVTETTIATPAPSVSSTFVTATTTGSTIATTTGGVTAAPSWDGTNCMPVENPRYYVGSALVCSCNDDHTYETIPTPGIDGPCGFTTSPGPVITTMPVLSETPSPYNPPITTTATQEAPVADTCDVSYKFVLDGFEIRGTSFDEEKFGTDGSGLHDELSGCGDVTKWHFEWTEDSDYEWFASGQLPVGAKGCIGRAVVSAGGADDGNCEGSG